MTFFRDVIDKLFPQKNTGDKVVHSQVIDRSEAFEARFQEWNSKEGERVRSEVLTGYKEKQAEQENSKIRVHLLVSKYSNGLAISHDPDHFTKESFAFLFDSLAEEAEKLNNYRKVNSDYSIREKNGQMETKEKYYLKPLHSNNDSIVDQQFGNILIEHILIDDKPSYIKLMANVYMDSNYSQARNFNELVSELLT